VSREAAAATAFAPAAAPPARPVPTAVATGPVDTPPGRRRPLYFVAAALVVVGLVLFVLVVPSAKVSIVLTGTPLQVNPTIQGTPDTANAGQADHVVTAVVSSDQSAQFATKPTGQKKIDAVPATTTVQVTNTVPPGGVQFTITKGKQFTSADGSIQFFVTQDTVICQGYNGAAPSACQAGAAPNSTVPVQAVAPGVAGNVNPGTLTVWSASQGNPCDPNRTKPDPATSQCHNGDITVTNPTKASGGVDAATQTVASDQDISGWNNQVSTMETTLTSQVNADMQQKAQGKVFAKDPSGGGTTLACDVTPPLPTANQQYAGATVTVACHGKGAAYSPADLNAVAKADLQKLVAQGDTLATDSITCAKPSVTQAADDGTVVVSISCTSFTRPNVDLEGLKTQITGKSPGDAKNIIQGRVGHVRNVVVSQSPIPFFWLPFFSSRIQIDESFVAQNSP
jgi:hypothetical protein